MTSDRALAALVAALLTCASGCTRKVSSVPSAPEVNNAYFDLTPGWLIRVVVPLVKNGSYRIVTNCRQESGESVCSAPDLIGYQVLYYSAFPAGNGRVKLKPVTSGTNIGGQFTKAPVSIQLPFSIPTKSRLVRLVYLIRSSTADHDMALISARDRVALDNFTEQLERRPTACEQATKVECAWIPRGISFRPESRYEPGDVRSSTN